MKRQCCFADPFIREQVDPRVQTLWRAAYGKSAPFGNLRQMWVRQHCSSLNPYDETMCPYAKRDCALSFLTCVELVTALKRTSPTGYFRAVARTLALKRAEDKPLARERVEDGRSRGDEAGSLGLHRTRARPVHIGDVLRSLDARPRAPRLRDDGKASTE